MGKLDYLSKYTSKPKKSKKSLSNIVTTDDSIQHETAVDTDGIIGEIKQEPHGFKRIDNKQVKKDQEVVQETVYRDLTGKVIDISTIQKRPKSQVVVNEQKVLTSTKTFTISKNDKEYNEAMKARTSHEDPFKTRQTNDRITYTKGINPPNRFGIKAGVLWDGIDRSNGFEKLVMRKRAESKASSKAEADEYEMDYEI